jgi:hypothetical protein
MQIDQIVALLVAERHRLDAAIQALQGSGKRRGRPRRKTTSASSHDHRAPVVSEVARVKRKHKLSAAARKAMADAARKRWAAIKAGKAPNPFAKRKGKTAKKG